MKIICIGRNYVEHISELGNEMPTAPVVFLKPSTAYLNNNKDFYHPEWSENIHFECELVYRVSKNGRFIKEKFAKDFYDAVSVGIDFTARDIQQQQKEKGLPWEIAKAFDYSAPIGSFIPLDDKQKEIEFSLKKNGNIVQEGNTSLMMHNIDQIIAYVSRYFSLHKGDFIFTGTPKGVGPIAAGDYFEGYIGEEKLMECRIK